LTCYLSTLIAKECVIVYLRANSKYLIISGHFLSIYDWLVAQTTKVIGAFKLFNRKFTILLGSVQYEYFEELDQMNWSARGNVLNQYLSNTSIGTTVNAQ
jgi:hypothetical protein